MKENITDYIIDYILKGFLIFYAFIIIFMFWYDYLNLDEDSNSNNDNTTVSPLIIPQPQIYYMR